MNSSVPTPIGACARCGGQRYAGLTHQCRTTVKVGGVVMSPGETVRFGQGGTIQPTQLFNITGLCGYGQHGFCQNRVYQGHDGERSVYAPCDCDCHEEAKAA